MVLLNYSEPMSEAAKARLVEMIKEDVEEVVVPPADPNLSAMLQVDELVKAAPDQFDAIVPPDNPCVAVIVCSSLATWFSLPPEYNTHPLLVMKDGMPVEFI